MTGIFLSLCSILPLKTNHLLGSFIGLFLYLFNSDTKRVTSQNIKICLPHFSTIEQQSLIKKSLIETGKNLTESGLIWNQDFAKNSKLVRNINGIDLIESSNKTILLVPHIGCWEITGRVLADSREVTFMYKPLKNKKQNDYLFKRRNQGNLSMATADKAGVIQIQRALKNGQLVGILPDQDPGEDGGIIAPFFNKEVNTMTLLVRLAKKHDAQVLMFWANRLEDGRGYDLNLEPININFDSDDILEQVTTMNTAIEDLIKRLPEQYMWSYRRFKSTHSYNKS